MINREESFPQKRDADKRFLSRERQTLWLTVWLMILIKMPIEMMSKKHPQSHKSSDKTVPMSPLTRIMHHCSIFGH